jgi:hypothetical protein
MYLVFEFVYIAHDFLFDFFGYFWAFVSYQHLWSTIINDLNKSNCRFDQFLCLRYLGSAHSQAPLKPRIEEAQKKLQIQIAKLDEMSSKMQQKDKAIFGRTQLVTNTFFACIIIVPFFIVIAATTKNHYLYYF